jgi:hypothetical protein
MITDTAIINHDNWYRRAEPHTWSFDEHERLSGIFLRKSKRGNREMFVNQKPLPDSEFDQIDSRPRYLILALHTGKKNLHFPCTGKTCEPHSCPTKVCVDQIVTRSQRSILYEHQTHYKLITGQI